MKDIKIKINKATRMVELSKSMIGNDGETLQSRFVFEFEDEFVSGQARLEYVINGETKYIFLDREGETYTTLVKSFLTKKGTIDMQLVISEGTDEDNMPIFKSNMFYLYCNASINAEIEEPEELESWLDMANSKLNQADNLDISATQTQNGTQIDITGKDGSTSSTQVQNGIDGKDGKDFTYEDFTEEQLENLRGPQGPKGDKGDKGDPGEKGENGTGVSILGSYTTLEELQNAHPTGEIGDAYLIEGNLYVWSATSNSWENVGNIKGPQGEQGPQGIPGEQGPKGDNGYTPIKGTDYWTQADKEEIKQYVKGEIPTKTSELTNDSNFTTSITVNSIMIVDTLPETEVEGVLYLVKESEIIEPEIINLYPSQVEHTEEDGFAITFKEQNVIVNGSNDSSSVWGWTNKFTMNLEANKTYYLQLTNISGSFDDSKRVSESDGVVTNVSLSAYNSAGTETQLISQVERPANGIYEKYTFTPTIEYAQYSVSLQVKKYNSFNNWTCSIVIAEEK